MDSKQIMDMIERHEGCRYEVYVDTEGIVSGGIGHAFIPGSPIPVHVVRQLFWTDCKTAFDDYGVFERVCRVILDDVRRAVIVDMLFNMGLRKVLGFKKMIKAIRLEDYEEAAAQLLDSRYAKQVKGRAIELAEMLRTGEYEHGVS